MAFQFYTEAHRNGSELVTTCSETQNFLPCLLQLFLYEVLGNTSGLCTAVDAVFRHDRHLISGVFGGEDGGVRGAYAWLLCSLRNAPPTQRVAESLTVLLGHDVIQDGING